MKQINCGKGCDSVAYVHCRCRVLPVRCYGHHPTADMAWLFGWKGQQ